MMSTSILLLAGVILLGVLVVLVAFAVILILQNRNEDAGMRPQTPPPQSYQSILPKSTNHISEADVLIEQSPGSGNPPWLIRVQQLAQSGQEIEAIKLFRQHTDMGLKAAKDAVEALAAGQVVNTTIVTADTTNTKQLTPETTNQIIQLLRENKKIAAIQLIREKTGYGLKEAKDIADALEISLAGGMHSG